MRKKLLITFLLLTSTTCWGEWGLLISAGQADWYIDTNSIKKSATSNSIHVWILKNFKKKQMEYLSQVSYYEFNCDNNGHRYLQNIFYTEHFANGKHFNWKSFDKEWQYLPLDTMMGQVVYATCTTWN